MDIIEVGNDDQIISTGPARAHEIDRQDLIHSTLMQDDVELTETKTYDNISSVSADHKKEEMLLGSTVLVARLLHPCSYLTTSACISLVFAASL